MVLIGNAYFLGFREYTGKDGKPHALVDLRSDHRNYTVACSDVSMLHSLPDFHKVAITIRLGQSRNGLYLTLVGIEKSN